MNIQYVTSKGFARYMTKYMAKTEPSHVFNITENDKFKEHIVARRLGAMEAMFLILGETICNSSIQVKFLNTDPPNVRSKAVLPIHLLINEDDDPYFKDPVEKYMNRPTDNIFDQITYPNYFENYIIQKNRPVNTRRNVYQDQLGNYIIKRTKPIIVRYRFLKVTDGELYFYQLLLKSIPTRSEDELKGIYSMYRDRYTSMYPHMVEEIQQNTQNHTEQIRQIMNLKYSEILNRLLSNLENVISQNISEILRNQLDFLKILPPVLPQDTIYQLPPDQYYVISTLKCYLGKRDTQKWPYFFVTGSAGTGKSYIIHLLVNSLNNDRSNYLLIAPTGVAAQNIGGTTIHSTLRIVSTQTGFYTLSLYDNEYKDKLKKIDTIIFEEISMVSKQLFEFISNMFATIHNNNLAFGGINVIVVGDLAQLPPVTGSLVFKSSIWKLFYPLFLRQPQRQQNQLEFYNMLQDIRLGNLTEEIWEKLQRKHELFNPNRPIDLLLNTTNIVGYRETADKINRLVCNTLPITQEKFMISHAIDMVNGEQWNANLTEKTFKSKTNLPLSVRL
jgi:PIF1-like helicase